MKYKNAGEILPQHLVEEIQKYLQGEFLYIPQKDKQTHRAVTEYKIEFEKRNNRIYKMHLEGMKNEALAQNFNLSQSSIRRIIIEQKKQYEVVVNKIRMLLPCWNLQKENITQIYSTVWQIGDAGELLLNEAMESLGTNERIYVFFHYFGMSCFARHGKLFEKHAHIEALIKGYGFEVEHENVYYSSLLDRSANAEVIISAGELSKGNQQYIEFKLEYEQVGGCEVHYLNESIAYLRWIYVNEDMVGKGIGTKCMNALKQYLYLKGIKRFDTDTALHNKVAQHYYEKNGFLREGITRSYVLVSCP